MRGHKVSLGWEYEGRSYTVEWRYTLSDSTGHPAMWAERVTDDETGESRPDLVLSADSDAQMSNSVCNEMCEAEESARLDAAERDVDMRMDERRGL
jgi:hypothetical protein